MVPRVRTRGGLEAAGGATLAPSSPSRSPTGSCRGGHTMMHRSLGRSGIAVSAMGLGCWAIGGPFSMDGKPDGWGAVDDAESIRAIQRAIDLGVTFFDTA